MREHPAMNAAAYGLIVWQFMTAAAMLATATLVFIFQGRPELLVTAPGSIFCAYIGMQFFERFARIMRGDPPFQM